VHILQREPAISAGTVSAVVALAAGFGFHWSPGVVGAVLAGVSLASSVIVRSRVVPVLKPPAQAVTAPPSAANPPAKP
jgi:hypothetical protein